MKFAKYQANNLIPEWRMKYLDYKKGKKLLKEVKKARLRQRISWTPTPRLLNGIEINGATPRSSFYSRNNKPEKRPRQSLPTPNSLSESYGSGDFSTVVGGQQSLTPASVGTRTPVGRRSMTVNFNQLQANLLQVRDAIPPPDRKLTAEIELVSLPEAREDIYNKAESNFVHWLDDEIKKIDDFYSGKEKLAAVRYKRISAQLEALRQLQDNQLTNESSKITQDISTLELSSYEDVPGFRSTWRSLINKFHASFDRFSSTMPATDHERRVERMAHLITTKTGYIDYRVARRRLKHAILEFYRSMDLLKEYRLLNRTALEKILKKFDKRCGRKVSGEYAEKLKSMHFEQSDELENLISQTENLYARHFEANNRKNAVDRLRSRDKTNEQVPAVFHVGLLLGLAVPFLLEGLVVAQRGEATIQTEFLMQVWGGLGLILLFLVLFGINGWVWHKTKINYTFIFEFDTKHHLDYRQYLELPSLLMFLGCVFFWLTFKNFWPQQMHATWYPLMFICICLGILVFPFNTLHRSSRTWFAIANFRILFSGLCAIEFRDFFLGDQYNSLSYAFANIPVFFCLYGKKWDPNTIGTCGSSHSYVLGFFSTLPAIWRFLQCIRRFLDTRHAFPHLVNAGKYFATMSMYMMLSLWRIYGDTWYKVLFILSSCINTLYCCKLHTVLADNSFVGYLHGLVVGATSGPSPFTPSRSRLRENLGIPCFLLSNKEVYYFAIIMDPIMRSSWLFYVAFPGQRNLNAPTALLIAIVEVFRRFMWNFFLLEKEHMTNVRCFIASRDVPLPFSLDDAGPERMVAIEEQSSMMDYTRNDDERSMNGQDEAVYDC